MSRRTRVAALALVGGDAAVLADLRPDPQRLITGLAAPHAWFAQDGVDGALATLAVGLLWVVAAWLAVGLLVAAASHLPGVAGALADRVCRLVLPRLVRNLLAGGAGLGVLLAPVAAGAAGPAHGGPAHPGPARPGTTTVAAPRWPVSPSASAPVPTPRWPSTPATSAPLPVLSAPTVPPAAPVPPSHRASPGVTVAPGDSLWLIAARRLGPHPGAAEIAASWPRWFAANRAVIGADPALITPGLVLHAPAASTEEPRT